MLGINQKNKKKLSHFGAPRSVLNAIKLHPKNDKVITSACCAIKNLQINLYDFVIREVNNISFSML